MTGIGSRPRSLASGMGYINAIVRDPTTGSVSSTPIPEPTLERAMVVASRHFVGSAWDTATTHKSARGRLEDGTIITLVRHGGPRPELVVTRQDRLVDIIADPSCASGFLSPAECTELAAMVAATRITSKVAAALEGFRKLCERLRPRTGDLEVHQLTHDERARIERDLLAAAREILEVLLAAGYDVDDAAESLQALAEAGQGVSDEPEVDECPGCGALQDEGTTPGCVHADGCGRDGGHG